MQNSTIPDCLTDEEVQALIQSLLKFACRAECGRPGVRWDQMADGQPELGRYSPETLRTYMNLCASFWLLRGFEDRGDFFVAGGLTELGGVRQKSRHRGEKLMTIDRVLILAYIILHLGYQLLSILYSIWPVPFDKILSFFSSLFA